MAEKLSGGPHGADTEALPPMTAEEANKIRHLDEYNARRFVASRLDCLNNIESMSPDAAKILGNYDDQENLCLGCKKIDTEMIKPFIEAADRPLDLLLQFTSNEADIKPEAAELLSRFRGDALGIHLNSLTVDVAKALSRFGSYAPEEKQETKRTLNLFLNYSPPLRIENIEPGALEALMDFTGGLELAISALTPEIVKILKMKKGVDTTIEGLTEIDDETAEALNEPAGKTQHGLNQHITSFKESNINIADYHLAREAYRDRIKGGKIGEHIEALPEEALTQIPEWRDFFQKRRHFKDLVWRAGEPLRKQLKENGVMFPECFYNLNALCDITPMMSEFISLLNSLPPHLGRASFETHFKTTTGVDFPAEGEAVEIYKDEIIQRMADRLSAIISNTRSAKEPDLRKKIDLLEANLKKANDARSRRRIEQNLSALQSKLAGTDAKEAERAKMQGQAEHLLAQFDAFDYIVPEKGGFRLSSRTQAELTLGDKCSDCTSASIGGMNFWTVPTWLTDPGDNFLLQYDEQGRLAHKFLVVWELKNDGTVMLTLDSMELGNDQKNKAGMYAEPEDAGREQKLMREAIDFIRGWAARMGLSEDSIYATPISNTGTHELSGYPQVEVTLTKIGGLEYAAQTVKLAGAKMNRKPRVYLQSYKKFSGEHAVDHTPTYRTVESVIRSYTQAAPQTDEEKAEHAAFQALIETARTDSREAARKIRLFLFGQASQKTLQALSVDGTRLDIYLHNHKTDFERYFSAMLSEVPLLTGKDFVTTSLYHLTPQV